MKKIDEVFDVLYQLTEGKESGVCAADIALKIGIDRTNVSRYLNELYKIGKIEKNKRQACALQGERKKEKLERNCKSINFS